MDPRRLRSGDSVAIIAPSSPFALADAQAAGRIMEQLGLAPVIMSPESADESGSITPAPLDVRVDELRTAVADPNIRAIIAAQGGLGASEMLASVPYEELAESQKILMGFSDVTALLNAVVARADLTTFCGPVALVRTQNPFDVATDSLCLVDALGLLMSGKDWGTQPFIRRRQSPVGIAGGRAAGRALGGNLTVLVHLLGTPYMPDLTDAVLFLEDVDVGGGELRRMLSHLVNCGAFERCAGVVFGEFANEPQHEDVPNVATVVRETFKRSTFPVIFGANFSHGLTMATLPIGAPCALDGDRGLIWFGDPLTD